MCPPLHRAPGQSQILFVFIFYFVKTIFQQSYFHQAYRSQNICLNAAPKDQHRLERFPLEHLKS